MSATLREYKSGRLRKRLWLRYDNAVNVLVEYANKFEDDEQPAANRLFRNRYKPVLDLLRGLIGENNVAGTSVPDDRGVRDGGDLRGAGPSRGDRGSGLAGLAAGEGEAP